MGPFFASPRLGRLRAFLPLLVLFLRIGGLVLLVFADSGYDAERHEDRLDPGMRWARTGHCGDQESGDDESRN
ncbi:MAG: hypothetical protein HYT40_01340 [Candidatus Sungbacteria bacterium]|uniref:Uncharacterized protein n=1 Tax=Candidatus Sungiibacteriota bacterium TaxID=2750080 RepID=A0A931SCY3_9BACT|nr:hypothetical protein [Candidatus Sungbacteria bacterium]